MATTAPPSAPPPSASFINMEDFDTVFPDPDAAESTTQDAVRARNPPLPFVYRDQNAASTTAAASSEASSSSTTSSTRDLGGPNWIGKLLEYQQAHPRTPAPTFTESTVPGYVPLFVCLVHIGERPAQPFGTPAQPSSTKKAAKQLACKLAVEWLVENDHMPSVDSVSFPRGHSSAPSSLGPAVPGAAAPPPANPTIGEQVTQLAHELRFNPPAYVMAADPAAPMLWSGYAHFLGDPRVDGRVGEFSNVFGKKSAKDACAAQVVEFLRGVKRHRESTAMEM